MTSRAFTILLLLLSAQAAEPVFKQAINPRPFSFPADHASHAGYQTEWWYVTGNLRDDAGKRYGYQFTIFRRALDPQSPAERGRASAWAAGDFYLLHLAVSAISDGAHADFEALERGALGVAGTTDEAEIRSGKSSAPRVWMKDAVFVRGEKGWTLKATSARISFDLSFEDTVAPVLHGAKNEDGLSRKGPRPGQASYYYSVPRLNTSGTLTLDGQARKIVSGLSWMDHEFGSNQLSVEQSGWEWISIHLDTGQSIMLYILRNKDGSIEPHSSGSWIELNGNRAHLSQNDFKLSSSRPWKSPLSGATYPLDWQIEIPSQRTVLKLRAALDDQEFHAKQGAGLNYYEGAAKIEGTLDNKPVKGEGYLEITGGA